MNNEGDVNQNISGNHNTQINSGNDTISAIGSGAIAAGRDIIINSNDDETIKVLKRQIELLEESLANSKHETDKESKRVFALEASIQAEKLQKEARIVFSDWKLVDLGEASIISGRLELAEGQLKQALRIFKEKGDIAGELEALRHLGGIEERRGNLNDAEQIWKDCLNRHSVHDDVEIAMLVNNIGEIKRRKGEYDVAKRKYQQSINIFSRLGERHSQSNPLNNLGLVCWEAGDLDSAEKYYNQALEIDKEFGDLYGQAQCLNNLAIIKRELGDLIGAKQLQEMSLELNISVGYKQGEAHAANNLGIIYRVLEDHQSSGDWFRNSLKIYREVGDKQGVADVLNNLAIFYANENNLVESTRMFEESLKLKQDIGDLRGQANTLRNLGVNSETSQNPQKAKSYYLRAIELQKQLEDMDGQKLLENRISNLFQSKDD